MRRVTLVRDLVLETVTVYSQDDVRYHKAEDLLPIAACSDIMEVPKNLNVTTVVCPVHHLAKQTGNVRKDWYIAYSPEVQELLELPLDTYKRQTEEHGAAARLARGERDILERRIKTAGLWDRIRYLFNRGYLS